MTNDQKKKGVLWYLGAFLLWIIAFPIMLVRFLYKKGILNKRIAIIIGTVLSLIWFPIMFSMNSSEEGTSSAEKNVEETTIKKLSFNKTDDITVRVGEITTKSYSNYIDVSTKSWGDKLNPDDILLISENPEIASIAYLENTYSSLYYSITGISAGETYVYAISVDGKTVSEKVKVIVPIPIEAKSIDVVVERNDLAIGESVKTTVTILPENADYKIVSWVSSDETVAMINEKGIISAVGDGITTITASLGNGLSSSFDIHVDGSKHLMRLVVTYPRDDDNNIGDEWSYLIEINGERPASTIALSAKDKLNFFARFSEEDDNPDIGEAKKTYTVTENDLINGFEVTMELKVKENGGKNSGKTAHFIVTFTFTPI